MPRYIKHKRHRVRHGLRHDRHVFVGRVATVGALQYSADGGTTPAWASAIGAIDLKVNTQVDYFVRLDPSQVLPADTGLYQYNFRLLPDPAGATPGQPNTNGIGGLTLTWAGNYARVQGKVPADQVGKKITIEATVKDMGAKIVAGTKLVGTWTV